MHVKCLPDARVSLLVGGDGTLRAFAQHLLENFMRFASAKPPPYRPLGCCLARTPAFYNKALPSVDFAPPGNIALDTSAPTIGIAGLTTQLGQHSTLEQLTQE